MANEGGNMVAENSSSYFQNSLGEVKLYDLPAVADLEGGAQLINSPAAAFQYAGNWYITPQQNGRISADPTEWALVTGDGSPNGHFYHTSRNSPQASETLEELQQTVGNSLSAKSRIGSLPTSSAILSPDALENIILSKEHSGSGVQIGDGSFLHDFVKEHGKVFKFTPEETARANSHLFSGANDAHEAQMASERLALHQATGAPFMAASRPNVPRERVFYATQPNDPEQVRRLKIGFDEELLPDGSRLQHPAIKEETISFADAVKEMGADAHIGHTPESIGAHFKGEPDALQRYAQKYIGGSFNIRKEIDEKFGRRDGTPPNTTTDSLLGKELTGKDITTQAWHRVVRPEDYVPQITEAAEAGSKEIGMVAPRILDTKRADYFMIRQHPDYTEYLASNLPFRKDYNGPMEQLLFLRGDSAGIKPQTLEKVDLAGGIDTVLEMKKRGIGQDTRLLKIGPEEYAELWNQRKLSDHINYLQLERETAKETIQTQPLKYTKFGTDHPLTEPIRFNDAGKLVGDVDGLCSNGLYKLGEDSFIQITPDLLYNGTFNIETYKKLPTGAFEYTGKELSLHEGSFEHTLTELIKQKGALTQASEDEVIGLTQHLRDASKAVGNDGLFAGLRLDQLLKSDKPKLPEGMGSRLQQEAAGTLDSFYSRNILMRKAKPSTEPKPKSTPTKPAVETVAEESRETQRVAPKVGQEAASAGRVSGEADSSFVKFMKNEKWAGKKGLVVAGATIAVGAIIYGVHKAFDSNKNSQKNQSWTSRVSESTPPQINTR